VPLSIMPLALSFQDGGDAGFYACIGAEEISAEANSRVHALAASMADVPGVTDLIPGYWNLFIEFNPNLTSRKVLEAAVIERISSALPGTSPPREVVIPVRYDGADLSDVMRLTGLTQDEIVALHTGRAYTVYALGFTPGFPYLGALDERLRVPRLETPRSNTPANSVAIANGQTGIYPMESPGGWRVIGTALRRVFDRARAEPFLLRAGDTVRFTKASASSQPKAAEQREESTPQSGVPTFRVLEPGLLSSLQDEGRRFVGRFGLARAGALDITAHGHANALIGNPVSAASLELTLRGPTLEVLSDTVIAVAGSGVGVQLNGSSLPLHKSFAVKRGDTLSFPPAHQGARAYLAVRGGFSAHAVYGSRSTDLRAGLGGRRLEVGDTLYRLETNKVRAGFGLEPFRPHGDEVLRVTPGPQAALFPPQAWAALTSGTYRVTTGDRMGLRLGGATLSASRHEIVSEGVPVGSLQVSSNGQPMLLMNDRGTLGGYAKIAVVNGADLSKAAQLRTGDRVRFKLG
jgi:KipI family sensor histidine kinase inhibitor